LVRSSVENALREVAGNHDDAGARG